LGNGFGFQAGVDGAARPGGGGLLLLQAADYREAEALIQQDPMLLSDGVEWTLQQWCPAVGNLGTPEKENNRLGPDPLSKQRIHASWAELYSHQ